MDYTPDNRVNPYAFDGSADPPRQAVDVDPQLNWMPDDHVKLHDGTPLPSWMIFLHFPPPEIGRIVSASADKSPFYSRDVLSIVLIPAFLIGSAIGWKEKSFLTVVSSSAIVIGCELILALSCYLLLFGISYLKGLFKIRLRWQRCSFVGEQGYAAWYQDRILPKEETCEYVMFANIKELDWVGLRDEQGKLVLGTYHALLRGNSGNYKDDPFIRAIELVWHQYFYYRWISNWIETRSGELQLSKTDTLVIEPRKIILQRAEKQLPIVPADVVKLAFTYDGQMLFYLAEEKLAENQGRLKYWLREMPNCLATMSLISTILNVPLTGQKLPFPLPQSSDPPQQLLAN